MLHTLLLYFRYKHVYINETFSRASSMSLVPAPTLKLVCTWFKTYYYTISAYRQMTVVSCLAWVEHSRNSTTGISWWDSTQCECGIVFKCLDMFASLAGGMRTAYFPNLTAASARISAGNSTLVQRLVLCRCTFVQPWYNTFSLGSLRTLMTVLLLLKELASVFPRR